MTVHACIRCGWPTHIMTALTPGGPTQFVCGRYPRCEPQEAFVKPPHWCQGHPDCVSATPDVAHECPMLTRKSRLAVGEVDIGPMRTATDVLADPPWLFRCPQCGRPADALTGSCDDYPECAVLFGVGSVTACDAERADLTKERDELRERLAEAERERAEFGQQAKEVAERLIRRCLELSEMKLKLAEAEKLSLERADRLAEARREWAEEQLRAEAAETRVKELSDALTLVKQ